jgi:electron transport complex protein RnfC
MARAKAQREAAPPRNTEQLNAVQQRELDEIEARRQAAGISPAAPAEKTE